MSTITGIIPARYASTRFPGKPLADIGGKTMIRRVYEQAARSKSLNKIIVATDDERIADEVKRFGGVVCLTSPNHPSGTDRCAEVIEQMSIVTDYVVNIQGDEPFIEPAQIDQLCSCFSDPRTELATLVKKITSNEVLFNPGSPKVVIDANRFAIYFSRSPIPFARNVPQQEWLQHHEYYQHIGIYGYRSDILKKITGLAPSRLEIAESLEQLRWIENGLKIKTAVTDFETIAIDTPDDLRHVLKLITPPS